VALGATPAADLRLNLERKDLERNERVEWAPTLGQRTRPDWYAQVRLPNPEPAQ
jgi:hypothetical protein